MGVIGCIIGDMLQPDTLQITPEILSLIARIDEFKGAWRALGTLAPDRLLALRRVATIESIGSSTRIEGAKMDLSGDRVNHVFYKENGLGRIAAYCGDDVIIVAQLYLRFHFLSIVEPQNIEKL